METKPTGVAKTIQHVAAPGQFPNPLTVAALIEIEAGFVAGFEIDEKFQAVFGNRYSRIGNCAAQQPVANRQTFEFTDIGIRAFIDGHRTRLFEQNLGQGLAPKLGAGGQRLEDEHITIPVNNQARESVGFGVDQAHASAHGGQAQGGTQRQG